MNKRVYYLDVLRVIACFSVIMIHVSARYVTKDFGTSGFWLGNVLDSISRAGFPLFLMISGSLLLDDKYSFEKEKVKKRVIKMIIFFIFWSLLYAILYQLIDPIIYHKAFSLSSFVKAFIKGNTHLWYIQLMVGIYLITPLLKIWVCDKNKKYVEYFLVLAIIFTFIIPTMLYILGKYSYIGIFLNDIYVDKFNFTYAGLYTTYFVLGWYLHNYEINHKKLIYLLGIIGLLISIFGTFVFLSTLDEPDALYYNFTINVFMYSVMIFVFIKSKFVNKNIKDHFIKPIADHSLGIYAVHMFVSIYVYRILSSFSIDNAFICIPVVFLATISISYIIAYILKKIPVLNKYVI